jgi:hypothetical protein
MGAMNISRFAPVLGLLILVGCGGGGGSSPAAALCAPPVLPTLVTPASGATGVSDTIGEMTLTNVVAGDVFTVNGSVAGFSQLAPVTSALPLPNTTVVTIPPLAAATTVQITLTGLAPDPCNSTTPLSAATLVNVQAQIGSFKSQ